MNDPCPQLRNQVIQLLASAGFWGNEQAIRKRMESDFQKFSSGEYSYYLSDEFDQSLIHLPNAFEYMFRKKCDYERVGEEVARFIGNWHSQLEETHLIESVVETIRQLLHVWPQPDDLLFIFLTDCPEVGDHFDMPVSLGLDPPLDTFLNALVEAKTPYSDDGLFSHLFLDWINEFSSAYLSARVLDLFFRVRCYPNDLKLHRDPTVLKFAFDKDFCRRHWETATAHLSKRCSERTLSKVQTTLIGTP